MYIGFIGTFLLFSGFTLFGILAVLLYIPNSLNKGKKEDEALRSPMTSYEIFTHHEGVDYKKMSYMTIFSNYECFIIMVCINIAVACTLYNESILAVAMNRKFDSS